MTAAFNIAEVLTMAVRMEEDGARFYRAAAELSTEPHSRGILLHLAEMEDEHRDHFARMSERLASDQNTEFFDPGLEGAAYLSSFVAGQVFKSESPAPAALATGGGISRVLDEALRLENETIAFYSAIGDSMRDHLVKSRIAEVIREEMSHVVMLANLRNKL